MERPLNDSRIIVPFMPSLFHMAMVSEALPLYNRFPYETLERAFADIQGVKVASSDESVSNTFDKFFEEVCLRNGRSTECEKRSKESLEVTYNKAKEMLLLIPNQLRRGVLVAVRKLHYVAQQWRADYLRILDLKDEDCTLHWRSDGTIDSTKTADAIVLNENIDIGKRFQMASIFCFEKRIKSLWTDMEASGISKSFAEDHRSIVRFWTRYMKDLRQVSWTEALLDYFQPPIFETFRNLVPRFSSFFPLLQPRDRQKFFSHLQFARRDDLLSCLCTVTKEEEDQILQMHVDKILRLYLAWPLRIFFNQTVTKVWSYIDDVQYCDLLLTMLHSKEKTTDFDYHELLKNFWNLSPEHFKEETKQLPFLRAEIDLHLNGVKRKRKLSDNIRKNLESKELSSDSYGSKKRCQKMGNFESTFGLH